MAHGKRNGTKRTRGAIRRRIAGAVLLLLAVVLVFDAVLPTTMWAASAERGSSGAAAEVLSSAADKGGGVSTLSATGEKGAENASGASGNADGAAAGGSLFAGDAMGGDGAGSSGITDGALAEGDADGVDAGGAAGGSVDVGADGAGAVGNVSGSGETLAGDNGLLGSADGDGGSTDDGSASGAEDAAELSEEEALAQSVDDLQASTVFYIETDAGLEEYEDLPSAVAAATSDLSTASSATIWQVKDATLAATQEVSIPAGTTLLIKGAPNAQAGSSADARRTLSHGTGYTTPLFWVKSGTLRFEDVVVDGKNVDAKGTVATYGSAGLVVAGTGAGTSTSARIEMGSGALFQNGRSTNAQGAGGVVLLGRNASMGMENGSAAQNCAGVSAGFVALRSTDASAPAVFSMSGTSAICGCVSTASGGAVTIAEGSGQVTLSGSAEIAGNTAATYGSAVYVAGTGAGSFVRIQDRASIHGNKVTGKAYLSGTSLNDYGRAAAVTVMGDTVPVILSGSPALYGNTASDGIANDISVSDANGGQLRIAGTLSPRDSLGNAGSIWVSAYNRRETGKDFAAAYDADGSTAIAATSHTGYGTLRNAIAKNTGSKVELWGTAGDGSAVVWSDTLTVTFDANGGLFGTATAKTVAASGSSGSFVAPAAPTDVAPPSDYQRLAGWNTAPDGTGTAYTPGAALSDSTTVYAQWENDLSLTFAVTYDAHGGHFSDKSEAHHAAGIAWDEGNPPVSPDVEEPTRGETYTDAAGVEQARYTFAGWSTDERAVAPDFTPGETRLSSVNQTVYAVWRDNAPDADAESPWRLYVSENGSDTAGTGTRAKPYRTFDKAFSVVKEGGISQGEGASGKVPKDPDNPALTWATVVLVGNWQLGKTNAAAVQSVDAGISVTVRGDTGNEVLSVGTGAASTDLFTVPANARLIFKNLTIDGKGVSGDHQAVYVEGRSDLTFGTGFTLRNWASTAEPAVQLTGMGTDNTAALGTFTMRRGSLIEGCISTSSSGKSLVWNTWYAAGGAVNIRGSATMVMQSGSAIKNCTAPNSSGGAIFLYGSGEGTHAKAAMLVIDAGASITGCSAATSGGAVFRSNNAIVELYGSISHCNAGSGGAIGDYDYILSMSQYFPDYAYVRTHPGSYVGYCEATGTQGATPIPTQGAGFGGAFGTSTYANFLLHGGTIEHCTAAKGSGGAVGGYAPNVWMRDGQVIKDCSAGYGGALALTEAALFEGGLIQNCQATGGTAYSYSDGRGGAIEISSNENPQVWMNLTIRDCTAKTGGGGVSVNTADSYDRIYIYGLTIEGCSAPVGGGFLTNNLTGGKSPSFMDAAQLATFNKTYANYLPGGTREPSAPVIIDGNTDGQGHASNLQTYNAETFGIFGTFVAGSSIGVTTGKTTSVMANYNKAGAQLAKDTGKAAGGTLSNVLFSDKDDSLVAVYQGTRPVWAQGWTVSYNVNAPTGTIGFTAEGMPPTQRAAVAESMAVSPAEPTGTSSFSGTRFAFKGWSTTSAGEVAYHPGDGLGTYEQVRAELDADGDHHVTLYAQWERIESFPLPNTGGAGVLGILAFSAALIAFAALLMRSRRRQRKA